MIADSLRKSILQAAIEGKLTEREPGDGDARDLLAEIQKEKARLVREGKIRRSATLPPVTDDEIPFNIPENWCWVRLGELVNINAGVSYKKDELVVDSVMNIRVLRGGNIASNKIQFFDNDLFLPSEKIKEEEYLALWDLITPAVTSLENIGKMAIVDHDLEKTAYGGFVFRLRLLNSSTDKFVISRYLFDTLRAETSIAQMRSKTNKSGQAFYNLGKERFRSILLPLPPLAEPRRIVARLEELLPLVEELGEMEKELSEL